MRRVFIMLAVAACLAGSMPATHAAGQIGYVFTENNRFVPGDPTLPVALTISRGSSLTYMNIDLEAHNVVSDATRSGVPLFSTPGVDTRGSAPVAGVSALPAGSYPFHCAFHPTMHGVLVVA